MRKISRLFLILIIGGSITAGIMLVRDRPENTGGILIEYKDSLNDQKIVIREYGLAVDSFYMISGKIRRDQTLSTILNGYGVSHDTIHKLALASSGVFDLRKIRMGKPFKLFCSKDSMHRVLYFVYEHTPTDYVMFSLQDSIRVKRQEKEVSLKKREVSGIITSSLWNTMLDRGIDPMLAFDLSEIYAWSIDFFGLQKGDGFKVYYEEQYADTNYIGLGEIQGAVFYHAGEAFYAVPFVQDSVKSFYDHDGNSLRKAFLKAPLRYSRISSRYSSSRLHPILKIRRPHLGVDYTAPIGTPVQAIGDGKIVKTGYTKGNGNWVKIQHNSVYATAYLHLNSYGKGIQTGTYVRQGDIIGYVGSTGLSTGPHLDFRFYKNGYPVDPLKVKAPPVEPVKEEYRQAYDSLFMIAMHRLDQISMPDSSGVMVTGQVPAGVSQ
ncbi:peptidoglycan DD-metalloendopeptidase family protein [Bacteroidota bacterium]